MTMTDPNFADLVLHQLKKIEVIVRAEDQRVIEDLLGSAGLGGWTLIRDVAGLGHGGFHQGRTIFNDHSGLVMFVAVGEPAPVADAARGLARVFRNLPGVTFLSDVAVLRSDYFATVRPNA